MHRHLEIYVISRDSRLEKKSSLRNDRVAHLFKHEIIPRVYLTFQGTLVLNNRLVTDCIIKRKKKEASLQ